MIQLSTSTPNLDIDTLVLKSGKHSSPDDGMCIAEATAYIAGEPIGYVLHKFKGCSAWFNVSGKLLDATHTDLRMPRCVKPYGPRWQELETVGRVYAPKVAAVPAITHI